MKLFSMTGARSTGQVLALIACVSALAPVAGPLRAAEADELGRFQAAIRAKYDLKEAAFAANDPEPILTQFYSEDVITTDPEGHTHEGRAALRPVYEEIIVNDVRIDSYRSVVNGDAGWDWVNFHVEPQDEAGNEPFTFKMLFLWERDENGEWWSHGEMYVPGEFTIR